MNLKQQVREAEMKLRRCESKAKTHEEQERCLRQYKIDVLKIKEEKQAQPMFKDTDKILVHRDGVDYQADIGPLMGGGGDSTCCPTCVEAVSATPGAYDNFTHPIDPGPDMGYIYSIGYHPDFGWRGICNKKADSTKAFIGIKPGASLDVWEEIGTFPLGEQSKFMGQMVPIGDKLVAILWGRDQAVYRLEFSESSITSEKIFDSNNWPDNFTYTNYDSERGTWFIRASCSWVGDNEVWEYNENTKVATELNANILNRTSVDGKIISVTTTGLEFGDGSTKTLWNLADVVGELPNNASITYSPELNQIAVVVSVCYFMDDLFNHARNLWVSDDKGATWRVIDTEPDPDWAGEIVQWSGINWLPNATNRKGTKGLWIAQSLRGGGDAYPDSEGHLHTLTSDDGVTWKFDYGFEWKHQFDGKYTVTDGSNYIVTGLGRDYGSTIDSVNPLQRHAYRSETATVQLPGTAVVESTEGLEPGMIIQSGDKRVEILTVKDGTTFIYAGEVTVGEEYCSTTPVHWDDIVGKPVLPKLIIQWDDIEGKPCIPECPEPSCTVEIEYLGNVQPTDFGEKVEEYKLPSRSNRSIQWHTYRLKDFSQAVLFKEKYGEMAWGDSLEFTDGFDAAGVIREADGTEFCWFQTYTEGPMDTSDTVVRTDTDLCSSQTLQEIIEDLTARVTALEAASP